MADRYTYVSLLGIFTILAWGGAELIARRPAWRLPLTVLAGVVVAACFVRTVVQVPVWKTGIGLIEHMHRCVGDHEIVYREKAMAALVAGRPEAEIMAIFRKGHEVAPEYPYFMNELAVRGSYSGQIAESRALMQRVIDLLPDEAAAHANFGNIALAEGKFDEAEERMRKALQISPRMGGVHRLLGEVLMRKGLKTEARDALLESTRCDRWDWAAFNQLASPKPRWAATTRRWPPSNTRCGSIQRRRNSRPTSRRCAKPAPTPKREPPRRCGEPTRRARWRRRSAPCSYS